MSVGERRRPAGFLGGGRSGRDSSLALPAHSNAKRVGAGFARDSWSAGVPPALRGRVVRSYRGVVPGLNEEP